MASDNGTTSSLSARVGGRLVQGGLYQLNEAGGNVPLIVNCPAQIFRRSNSHLSRLYRCISHSLSNRLYCHSSRFDARRSVFRRVSQGTRRCSTTLDIQRVWVGSSHPKRTIQAESFGQFFDLKLDPDEKHPLENLDPSQFSIRSTFKTILEAMPPVTPLPFEHRSLSAFRHN